MKNTIKLFGFIALVAVIGFSFLSCEPEVQDDNSKKLSTGTYNGTPKGVRTLTDNQTLNGGMNAGALDTMTAPSFVINDDKTMVPIFSGSAYPFLALAVIDHPPLFRFVLGSDNKLTLETKLWTGSGNNYGNWEDWNTREANAIGATVVKSLSGSFDSGTGKVTLVFTYTLDADSSSRTYEFAKK